MSRLIRFANLNAYKLKASQASTAVWGSRITAIREIAPDVLALQEVIGDETLGGDESEAALWAERAKAAVEQVAAECGLSATTLRADGSPGRTAMASNVHRGWFTALLWNPQTVRPVPGGFRSFGAPDFWHGVTHLDLDIGARSPVSVVSYHGHPASPDRRRHEALMLKLRLRATGGAKPGIVLGDFNALSAARVSGPDGQSRYYDDECYAGQDHDDLEHQVLEGTIGGMQLADRRQTELLLRRGFMVDAAAHLGVPWHPTVGHWEDGRGDPDPWGQRRIDLILATRPVVPALVDYATHDTPATREASDHLPVVCTVDPSKISREP